ncbi:MAG: SO_0444 family Cu/Zn efflux transporter [bacterium]|nr:SO_0444 family Cu/Zn efflux transporter [bacterium]
MWSTTIEIIQILNESAGFLLVGFLLAGVLHWGLSRSEWFARMLSTRGSRSVFLAAVFGLPLPLCSCSVLPAGLALRKKGASKGATVSFLISVPETDIVSIVITYGLLGPLMAIFRPFAALVTAIVTGLAANATDRWVERSATDDGGLEVCEPDCCDNYRRDKGALWNILHYGFVKFFDDIIGSLLLGVILGGLITALLPALELERFADQSLLSMLVMLVVGIPMYVCAASSTPIALGLIASGVSPGAALVFLLAGPATNTASLVVLAKHLGRPVLAVYLCSIAVVSVLMGLWLDALMAGPGLSGTVVAPLEVARSFTPLKVGGSVLLLILSYASFRRTAKLEVVAERLRRWTGLPFTTRRTEVAALAVAVLGYIGGGFFVVDPGERGVVTRFGRITQVNLEPGLHYHWPYPVGRAEVESITKVRRVELGFRLGGAPRTAVQAATYDRTMRGESWMLTGHEDIIDITWVVQYRVVDSEEGLLAYLYGVEEPEQLVRDAAEAAIRAAVGSRGIDTLLTTERAAVQNAIKTDLLQPLLDQCASGIEVVEVSLLDVHAPPDVHWDFRDIASAAEDKMTSVNSAHEYQERVEREAQGDAARLGYVARGRAVELVEHALGESIAFGEQWAAYSVHPAVTRLRLYLESVDAVFPTFKKYIHGAGAGGQGLDLWLLKGDPPAVETDLPQLGVPQ